jgi:hypothetical protein
MKTRGWAVGLFVALLSTSSWAADVVVLESSASAYPVGKTLSATTVVKLVAGEALVIVTEDARIVRVEGPHDGPAVGAAPDESAIRKALNRLVNANEPRVGGVGAVRGDETPEEVVDTRPEPWLIHSELDGEQCVLRDRPVEVWREAGGGSGAAEVTSAESDAAAMIRWADGVGRAAWPADAVPVLDDHIYLVRPRGATRSVAIRIRALEPAVADNRLAAAAWLAAKGCLQQARLTLR